MNTSKEIGLYIHIPFCRKKCNYCDFPSYAGLENLWEAYFQALCIELAMKAEQHRGKKIKTIFIGGGTPSLVPHSYIVRLMEAVGRSFQILASCEVSLESNPGTLTAEKLKGYRASGINRLSMGLQACQDRLLKKLGRTHSCQDFREAVFLAQTHGFENINADIIFGIPDQTSEDWKETVERVLDLGLAHISCYSLKIEEGTAFGNLRDKGRLREVPDELDRSMYHFALERLDAAGFTQYEISNFAKPQYVCRHNMNYWERGEYIGVGAGAHSFTGSRRYANTPAVADYIEGVKNGSLALSEDSTIDTDEAVSEKIILGLRTAKGIDLAEIYEEFGVDAGKKYEKNLDKLVSLKLVDRSGSMVRLTKKGMDLANLVFIEFI